MFIEKLTFNPFQENTYIIHDEHGNAWIIDPGCHNAAEEKILSDLILSKKLNPVAVLNTHCHIDHVVGNHYVCSTWNIPLFIPEGEEDLLRSAPVIADNWGFPYHEKLADGFIEAGNMPSLNLHYQVLQVPGHSPGHIALYFPDSADLISGDVLFYQSIGRTDLPGGNHDQLIASIRNELFTLPNEVKVHPGHGPSTSTGYEKKYNPFCATE